MNRQTTEERQERGVLGGASLTHLELAIGEGCAEGDDVLGGDVAGVGPVLGHLILQGDEADGGALLLLQAEELQNTLVVIDVAVDVDEQDLGRKQTKQAGEQTLKNTPGVLVVKPLNKCSSSQLS